MKKLKLAVVAVLGLIVTSALAFPPVATLHTYYDANGVEIGWRFIGCTGSSSSGQTTNYARVEVEEVAKCGWRGDTGH